MKLILEYRKPNSRWQSLGEEIKVTSHSEVEMKIFGEDSHWNKDGEYDERTVDGALPIRIRQCPIVSYATLQNLYETFESGRNAEGIPQSSSRLKVDPKNVAILTIYEYETCLKDAKNILEYEALLAAAKHIEDCGYEVRFFVFRN